MMLKPWENPAIWHAINVHLPIVLLLLGLPLVCVVAISRGRNRSLRWGVVGFYAAASLAAWFAMRTGERAMRVVPPTMSQAAWDRVNFHEEMARWVWVLGAATTMLLLLANVPRRWARQTFTTLALVFSVVTVGWVTVTAHSGGLAVYDHNVGTLAMHEIASPVATPVAVAPATQLIAPAPSAIAATPAPQPLIAPPPNPPSSIAVTKSVSYTRDIKPLLSSKCSECHEGDTLKGGFNASSVAGILKGGKKAGAGLVAGKPEDSAIIQYVEGKKQPRMPKNGRPLNDEQVAMLRTWIASGAIDDTGAKVVDATTKPAPAPAAQVAPVAQEKISEDWDPQVQFNADEAVAVRRYVRLKNLPAPPAVPQVSGRVFNVIDRFIVAKCPQEASAKTQTTPATTQSVDTGVCDDVTFVRRVYLDLIGVIPTATEAHNFFNDKDAKKREKLVDALLARTGDYAANWVPFWEEALCSNGLHQGGVGTHGNYRAWIFNAFDQNKPYDTMVQELLDPTMPNHPQRYVLNDNHERTIQSSANTAQVFLGTAIKCASCHSHFLNDEWPQKRAVAFAGFFSDKDLELIRCERKSGDFVQTHFMFDLPAAPTTTPADQNARLHRLAQLVTDPTNPRFAKTIVNRLWKRYMGLGLFEPVDDYREDTPPSHPELLNWLADDFIRHGYDVKHTIRLILTSRMYQLRYDPTVEDKFEVEKPKAPRYFRSPGLRRLTAEQLLDSIAVTMGQKMPGPRAYQNDESTTLTRSLGKPAARNEVSTARPDDTAIVQALELLNGQEYSDRIYKGALVSELAVNPNVPEIADRIYWSTLGRAPTAKEKEVAINFVKSAPAPATTQPTEVVWLDDELPPGANKIGNWKFAGGTDQPVFSGKLSHTESEPAPPGADIQHLFVGGAKFAVQPKDTLFTYVYLDVKNPPKEIMVQFHFGGNWNARAAFGESKIEFKPKTTVGKLPKAGEWVRLEMSAEKIGITTPQTIEGLSFDQYGGKVYWDKTGAMKGPPIHDPQTIGDMLWALVTSPEFQYIK